MTNKNEKNALLREERKEEILSLASNPIAFFLLDFLREKHDGIRKEFKIPQEAIAKTLKKDKQTIRKAIEFLLEKKFLSRKQTTNPYIYKFI